MSLDPSKKQKICGSGGDTMAGWISVHRRLQNHWLWQDKPFAKGQAWIDLLQMACYEDKKIVSKGEAVEVKRGSFLTSDKVLTDRWGWNRKKTRIFLDLLIREQMIELQRTPKGTSLRILNYDFYQTNGTTSGTSLGVGMSGLESSEGTTFGTTSDIDQNGTTFGPTFGTTNGTGLTLATSQLQNDEGPTNGTDFGTTFGTLLISLNKSNKSNKWIKEDETSLGSMDTLKYSREPWVSEKRATKETPEQAERRRQRNAEFLKQTEALIVKGVEVK